LQVKRRDSLSLAPLKINQPAAVLTLTLLVTGFFADNTYHTTALDNFAITADFFN
jgi:hypothetical protein